MLDFWLSCGHHLLDRDDGGGLLVTDEFLKAYLARPELAPPPDACIVERTLHAALLTNPRRPVAASEIGLIADADARENWSVMIAFRDHLINHRTVEAAYLELVRRGATHVSYTLVLDDNWPSRRTAEKLGARVCANYVVYRRPIPTT
jgi:hypothetical protein